MRGKSHGPFAEFYLGGKGTFFCKIYYFNCLHTFKIKNLAPILTDAVIAFLAKFSNFFSDNIILACFSTSWVRIWHPFPIWGFGTKLCQFLPRKCHFSNFFLLVRRFFVFLSRCIRIRHQLSNKAGLLKLRRLYQESHFWNCIFYAAK